MVLQKGNLISSACKTASVRFSLHLILPNLHSAASSFYDKINELIITPEPPKLSAEEEKGLEAVCRIALPNRQARHREHCAKI